MKQQSQSPSPSLLPLPYMADSLWYFHIIAAQLPMPLILQSDAVASTPDSPSTLQGRFDIITAAPEYWLETDNGQVSWRGQKVPEWNPEGMDSFSALHKLVDQIQRTNIDYALCAKKELPFCGGLIGYCSYDLAREYIPLEKISSGNIAIPDMQFGFYGWAFIQDHLQKQSCLVIHPSCASTTRNTVLKIITGENNFSILPDIKKNKIREIHVKNETDFKEYSEKFSRIIEYINAGDCYQVNFSQRFNIKTEKDAATLYKDLRKVMPSPFSGLLPVLGKQASIISLSPERFIKIDTDKTVTSQPIKGTAERFTHEEMDQDSSRRLTESEKCKSENLMIVDLIRNDLGKCCETGSIKVRKLFELQSFANVHHLVSTIEGKLKPGLNGADVLQGCFPGGSITGAPKIRAMEIINELETTRRSVYCGSMVIFSAHGTMDSNIMIRTVLLDQGTAYCWAGGGIIAESTCRSEYDECLTKVGTLLKAIPQ